MWEWMLTTMLCWSPGAEEEFKAIQESKRDYHYTYQLMLHLWSCTGNLDKIKEVEKTDVFADGSSIVKMALVRAYLVK